MFFFSREYSFYKSSPNCWFNLYIVQRNMPTNDVNWISNPFIKKTCSFSHLLLLFPNSDFFLVGSKSVKLVKTLNLIVYLDFDVWIILLKNYLGLALDKTDCRKVHQKQNVLIIKFKDNKKETDNFNFWNFGFNFLSFCIYMLCIVLH